MVHFPSWSPALGVFYPVKNASLLPPDLHDYFISYSLLSFFFLNGLPRLELLFFLLSLFFPPPLILFTNGMRMTGTDKN